MLPGRLPGQGYTPLSIVTPFPIIQLAATNLIDIVKRETISSTVKKIFNLN